MDQTNDTQPRRWYRDEIDEFLEDWAVIEEGLGREIGEMRPWFWTDSELALPVDTGKRS